MSQRDGTPFDQGWVNFVAYPGSPSSPGASDFNRYNFDLDFLSNPPSARLGRTDTGQVPSSLSFVGMYWNVKAWASDPSMVAAGVGTSGAYTDRILCPYPGEWESVVVVRSQFNNTAGTSQIQLMRVDNTSTEVLIDQDTQACNAAFPNNMRMVSRFLITAAMVANQVGVRVEYAQNSGGNAAIYATTGVNAYPSFAVRWVGTGNL